MADIVSPEKRSQMMARIRGRDTRPEVTLRKALHRLGFRYRTCCRKLPGSPDIVLPRYRSVIFVHGCFWHGHECPLFRWPKTRPEFWKDKINTNRSRDAKTCALLKAMGWRVLVVWECEIRNRPQSDIQTLADRIAAWIRNPGDGQPHLTGASARSIS